MEIALGRDVIPLTLLTRSSVFRLSYLSNCSCVMGGSTALYDRCAGRYGACNGCVVNEFVIDAIPCNHAPYVSIVAQCWMHVKS